MLACYEHSTQNGSHLSYAHLPVGTEVLEVIGEHILFEWAKSFCDSSLGTQSAGEYDDIVFFSVMLTEVAWNYAWRIW